MAKKNCLLVWCLLLFTLCLSAVQSTIIKEGITQAYLQHLICFGRILQQQPHNGSLLTRLLDAMEELVVNDLPLSKISFQITNLARSIEQSSDEYAGFGELAESFVQVALEHEHLCRQITGKEFEEAMELLVNYPGLEDDVQVENELEYNLASLHEVTFEFVVFNLAMAIKDPQMPSPYGKAARQAAELATDVIFMYATHLERTFGFDCSKFNFPLLYMYGCSLLRPALRISYNCLPQVLVHESFGFADHVFIDDHCAISDPKSPIKGKNNVKRKQIEFLKAADDSLARYTFTRTIPEYALPKAFMDLLLDSIKLVKQEDTTLNSLHMVLSILNVEGYVSPLVNDLFSGNVKSKRQMELDLVRELEDACLNSDYYLNSIKGRVFGGLLTNMSQSSAEHAMCLFKEQIAISLQGYQPFTMTLKESIKHLIDRIQVLKALEKRDSRDYTLAIQSGMRVLTCTLKSVSLFHPAADLPDVTSCLSL